MIRPLAIFSVRPWDGADGDPAHPKRVLGRTVTEELCERPDAAGALVELDDRRYALTGTILAIGAPRDLRRYVRRRAHEVPSSTEQRWLARVAKALDRGGSATSTHGT